MFEKVDKITLWKNELNSFEMFEIVFADDYKNIKIILDKFAGMEVNIEKQKDKWVVQDVEIVVKDYLISRYGKEIIDKLRCDISGVIGGKIIDDKVIKKIIMNYSSGEFTYYLYNEGKLINRNEIVMKYVEKLEEEIGKLVDFVSEMI